MMQTSINPPGVYEQPPLIIIASATKLEDKINKRAEEDYPTRVRTN
jgi:hypothetical protein